MRRFFVALWALALTVAAFGQPDRTSLVTRVYLDASQILHIVEQNGKEVVPPKEKDQVAFSSPAIAPDRKTVGWLVDVPNCCTSYPIAVTLVVYRSGKIVRRLGNESMIAGWGFRAGGTQVAFYTNTVHGDLAPRYELHDVKTGRLVASWEGHLTEASPSWTAGLPE